jgi:acetylornithine deacetylase/succinyl-diaminopimelate desuccinylase-like protein
MSRDELPAIRLSEGKQSMTRTPRYTRRQMLQVAGQLGAGLATAACFRDSTPPDAAPAPGGIDPADLDPLALTVTMVRFDTSHNGEGGVTLPHAQWLKAKWDAAGATTEIIPTPKPDNVHFLARIKGAGPMPPLLLLGHSDVVSVERDRWSIDPYSGEVKDGWVYGRGTLDMKGTNAAFMSALLRHRSEGAVFDRDIMFLSDCDEEAGPHGARWLAERHWDKIDAGAVLTEGGWLLTQRDGTTPMMATLTRQDKISASVELSAQGTTTHSSKPLPDAAIVRLNRALVRLSDYQPAVFVSDVARGHFEALAERTENAKLATAVRLMLGAPSQDERDRAGALVAQLSDYPALHNAFMRHTLSVVIQQAGYRVNVIPGTATARVNVRFVPGGPSVTQTLADMRAAINDPQITMRLRGFRNDETHEHVLAGLEESMTKPASSTDTDVFRAWQQAVANVYPQAVTVPGLFEAGTSAGVWRERGIPVYGIYPYAVDNDTINRMHGNDERLRVDALQQGTQLMYELFGQFRSR